MGSNKSKIKSLILCGKGTGVMLEGKEHEATGIGKKKILKMIGVGWVMGD